MARPTTRDKTTTMASGLVSRKILNASKAGACARNAVGFSRGNTLLDVPQSSQTFLHVFLGSITFVRRQDLLDFLFQHVGHEFVDGFVSGSLRALLDLLQQFTLDLDLI